MPRAIACRLVAACLLASVGFVVAGCGRDADAPDPTRIVEAFDAMAERSLWPEFDPRGAPLAWYDGRRSFLVRHPQPPEGFSRLRGLPEGWRIAGRHEAIRASSVVELNGVPTATAWAVEAREPEAVAATLIHEAFHAFQDVRHPAWTADEMALFAHPVLAVRPLQLRRLETEALRRAILATDAGRGACWARGFLALRGERFRSLPPEAASYERATELREGLALYVERLAAGDTAAPSLPYEGFPAEEVRRRGYAMGRAQAHFMDRLERAEGSRRGAGSVWKAQLGAGEHESLDAALSAALAGFPARVCRPSSDESRRTLTVARADSARAQAERTRRLTAAVEAPGWRVVVRAAEGAPLWPRTFDPMNLVSAGGGRILHDRWLHLAGEAGELEVIDRASVTVGSGGHPLFEGIGEVVVAGLSAEPRVEIRGDSVLLEGDGLRGSFAPARVEREGRTLTVLLAPAP